MKKPTMRKVKSLYDLTTLAASDSRYVKLMEKSLLNLGCEHLAENRGSDDLKRFSAALGQYLMCMVAECGEREDRAEKDLIGEINLVLSNCKKELQGT